MNPPMSYFPPWITRFITCTARTETIPGIPPRNTPAVGAIKSKNVNFTFEPRRLVKGICMAIRLRSEKRRVARKILFFLENFIVVL